MAFWLLKTEPGAYSFDDLERDGSTYWDGVRNYQARNNLQAMNKGDRCIIYHSVGPKEAVGIAKVTRTAYQDPETDDERWVAVGHRVRRALVASRDAFRDEGPSGAVEHGVDQAVATER